MGGFLFNGCGASDSYSKVMDLKQGYCRTCRKQQMFALYELDRKVRVVWIPTVSLSKKNAVICDRCKNGQYVEGEVLNALLAGRAELAFGEDGMKIFVGKKEAEEKTDQLLPKKEDIPKQEMPRENAKIPAHGISDFKIERRKKKCPGCGLLFSSQRTQCSICGMRLEEQNI